MTAEDNFRAQARQLRRQDCRPIIASMPGVNDLNALRANESRRLQNERQLEGADRQRVKSNAKLLRDFRKLSSGGTSQPDFVSKLRQRVCNSDRTIIRAPAREHRVQVKN